MSRPDIEAVSFDAAGTLIHLNEPVGASYARVAADHGIRCQPEDVGRAFRVVWKRTPPAFSPDSSLPDPDEKSWWRRLVRDVFAEAGATFPSMDTEAVFDAFFEALYQHFEAPGTWEADPVAAEVVGAVASRYRCAVLSNFDARLRRILDDLGLLHHFEKLFLSCELGVSKPDPGIFHAASRNLGVAPGSILHVGDDPENDWRGARDAGFRVFEAGRRRPLGELLGELSLA